jgi:cytochrome c oxidase cbb3-type subunit 2
MTLRTFLLGLIASFGLPWLLVVVVPFLQMRTIQPSRHDAASKTPNALYHPKRAGRTVNGAAVYAANGCYECHTQMVRPTYAGHDMFRADWGGLADDADRGDTRRETNVWDFQNESFAQLGVTRIGPDLSNVGRRIDRYAAAEKISAQQWVLRHLYDPRVGSQRRWSACPPHRFLFEEAPVRGQASNEALPVSAPAGRQVLAGEEARALASYLLGLRKDDALPAALNPAPQPPPG